MRAVVGLSVVATAVAGCGRGGTPAKSSTPRITLNESPAVKAALLTTAELRAVPGIAATTSVVALNDLQVFEDPDPRGPCGAKVAPLARAVAAGAGIQGSAVQGTELVVRVSEATAKAYLAALVHDARRGCPAFVTRTNTGAPQTVTPLKAGAVPGVADGAMAASFRLTSGTNVVQVTHAVVRRGAVVATLTLFAPAPLGDPTVAALLRTVAVGLARLG